MIRSNRTLRRHKYPIPVKRPVTTIVDFETSEVFIDILPIFGFTRPLSDNETRFLEDGQRTDDFLIFDCATVLYAADDKLGVKGDIIFNHKGFDWRIVGAKYWGRSSNRHNWYKIQKIALGGTTKGYAPFGFQGVSIAKGFGALTQPTIGGMLISSAVPFN